MLKRMMALLLLVVIGLSLVACAPKECEECGVEDKKLNKVEVNGDKRWLCRECEKDAFAPDACEACGAGGKKLKKVKVVDEKLWLCPDCQALAELANQLYDYGY